MSGDWATQQSDDVFVTASTGRRSVQPSRAPELASLAALAASLGLVALSSGDVGTGAAVTFALFGYVFTPFGVVGALAVARRSGLENLDDPWFDRIRLRSQMRLLQALVLVAFVIAVPHVFVLARVIQGALGLG